MLSNDNKVDDDEGITNGANIKKWKKKSASDWKRWQLYRGNEKVSFHISTNEERGLK